MTRLLNEVEDVVAKEEHLKALKNSQNGYLAWVGFHSDRSVDCKRVFKGNSDKIILLNIKNL